MKVDILTFSKALNRGANMQCFALAKTLRSQGHDVEFIDIQMPAKKLSLKGWIYRSINEWKIGEFRKKHSFRYTRKYNSYEDLVNDPPKTDLLVIGSDQVWNNSLTKRFDSRVYYGGFIPGIKKISYAASFGLDFWCPTSYDQEINDAVSELSYISVREDSGIDICRSVFGREDVECVVDPTLLLNSEDLKCIIGTAKAKTFGKTYVYLLHKDKQIETITKSVIDKLERTSYGFQQKKGIASIFATSSIPEWLANIKDAEYIVTNSFHCMVMCILLHKEFYIIPTFPGREIRMTSLMDKLGINNRYIDTCDFSLQNPIDYGSSDLRLNQLRTQSMDYLKRALEC